MYRKDIKISGQVAEKGKTVLFTGSERRLERGVNGFYTGICCCHATICLSPNLARQPHPKQGKDHEDK
jgi:hypothetical protein